MAMHSSIAAHMLHDRNRSSEATRTRVRVCTVALLLLVGCVILGLMQWYNNADSTKTFVAPAIRLHPIALSRSEQALQYDRMSGDASRDELLQVWNRVHSPPSPYWSELVHLGTLHGRERSSPSEQGSAYDVFAMALNSDEILKRFPKSRLHQITPFGVAFTFNPQDDVRSNRLLPQEYALDMHRGATLSMLGMAQVASSEHLTVRGVSYTVANAIQNEVACFTLDGEIEWTVLSFAIYLPPATGWQNKWGDAFTFDLVADYLANQPFGNGACFGSHKLYALAALLNANHTSSCLAQQSVQKADAHLKSALTLLSENQNDDGSFRIAPFLSAEMSRDERRRYLSDSTLPILLTSHSLEWIAIAPDDIVVDPRMIDRACYFLLRSMRQASDTDLETQCALWTHVGNALQLWHDSIRPNATHNHNLTETRQ
jgi:hypothetical protein